MNKQGLLADKKREGRCSGDYFVFNAFEIHFSGFIEALDSKGILRTLKKVSSQQDNALTLQIAPQTHDSRNRSNIYDLSTRIE